MTLCEPFAIDNAEPALLRACAFALGKLGIGRREVVAAFVFGSRAKAGSRPAGDFDLIFIIDEASDHPGFSYRRLFGGAGQIDANAVKASCLNELCRSDVGWSYRLHRMRPIEKFTAIPQAVLSGWSARIDQLVESPTACRNRLIRHIRDCRSLLRGARRFDGVEPGLARYLMIEAVFVLPSVYLNYGRIVPFQDGIPWDEALNAAAAEGMEPQHMSEQYQDLAAAVAASELFRGLGRNGDFAGEIKRLRDRCRTAIMRRAGNVFRDGYGARLASLLASDAPLRDEIRRLAAAKPELYGPLIETIWTWLNLARQRRQDSEFPAGVRTAVRRRRTRDVEPRYVHYDVDSARLKAIVPTGGCKVPTCTFCMLPSLARSKANVEDIVAALKAECRQRPVRQLTVYTDGSFFDRREVDRDERLAIARTARDLGAEEFLVESLPRFLQARAVGEVADMLGPRCRLKIGIGVQSTDALVRRYVTRTPIAQDELRGLLQWRRGAPFALRFYLLANKPMMSAAEDRRDLARSLRFLNEWLTDQDTVTVNPLLPTHATVLEKIWSAGFWRPLRFDEVEMLKAGLQTGNYAFRLEFGPADASTCSELAPQPAAGVGADIAPGPFALADAAFMPWAILGSLRCRGRWATKGGLART